jgi:hypothetical protein
MEDQYGFMTLALWGCANGVEGGKKGWMGVIEGFVGRQDGVLGALAGRLASVIPLLYYLSAEYTHFALKFLKT